MPRILANFLLIWLGHSAASAETLGTIQADWEGQARTWYITTEGGESQSSVNSAAVIVDSVILWGNPQESDLAATSDVVELTFHTMRGPKGKIATGSELQVLLDAYHDLWDASDEGQSQVTLTAYDKPDSTLHLAGTFHAKISRAAESRDIDGTFDVTFPTK